MQKGQALLGAEVTETELRGPPCCSQCLPGQLSESLTPESTVHTGMPPTASPGTHRRAQLSSPSYSSPKMT